MTRTQIQFPDPLYRRLKDIAEANDWSLAEVVRRAAENYSRRFPDELAPNKDWSFPTIDGGGDFLVDPGRIDVEAEAITMRGT